MKVKIGEIIYDSATEPVMLILSDSDKENIINMPEEATKYASFPDSWGLEDEMRAWMLTPNAGGNPTARMAGRLDQIVGRQAETTKKGKTMKTYDSGASTHGSAFRWIDLRARLLRWFDREREIVTLRNVVGIMAEARRSDASEYREMEEALRKANHRIFVLESHLNNATAKSMPPTEAYDRGGQRNENNEGDLVCN